ncbi:FAD-dependent oxidoreductase [Catellatospora methionotrophica]|uniref:FAD-dependent oxidoreductase n=1 Tax=Catellatospora methionotrophica TaxID=121620 RepID=A0A8J3PIT6_9ACTN|nr:FAD-dependent oxidoreductase [Catellatospora methionotrophica]GIG16736.1 FAD-dependent oxidoreductase [Catellatospora methionotrophica]
MFESLSVLDERIREELDEHRFYSRQSWVPPTVTADGDPVHDVVVVGAGQSGLALAAQLKLRGVRRVVVVDRQPVDEPGPWSTFARMPQLRTPKSIPGPDCGYPLLRFKTWFCSAYSAQEYARFEFIPLPLWRDYLAWFRRVLDIDVIGGTEVVGLRTAGAGQPGGHLELDTVAAGGGGRLSARKVCLATGMTGAGRWAPPDGLVDGLPAHTVTGAWEPVDWTSMRDTEVAVIGAGATGFDNAVRALDAGCRSVTVFARRPFPKKDLYFEMWRGRDDSGVRPDEAGHPPADLLDALLAYHRLLPDHDRLRLLDRLFAHGRSPANPDYLARVRDVERIRILEGCPVDGVDYDATAGKVLIRSGDRTHAVDRIVLATGPQPGLHHRPELASLADRVLTWGDHTAGARTTPPELAAYPKLTTHYQLRAKDGDDAGLSDVYSLADLVHATVGLQSIQHVAPVVADHIAAQLYRDHLPDTLAFVERLDD